MTSSNDGHTHHAAINCDVLIAGAGMAGLFTAWRLLKNQPQLTVRIVDKLPRTGGRLQTTTVNIHGADGNFYEIKDEEGGMRFVPQDKGMENLWKLITELRLETSPFVMGDENNRYYYRGQSFTRAQATAGNNAIWKQLYQLAPTEQNLAPVSVLLNLMNEILRQNGTTTIPDSPQGWIEFRNYFTFEDCSGTPILINNWGLWSLMRTYGFTQECITMISQALGFMGPLEADINAGSALQILFDFPAAASFFTLTKGYEDMPDTLTAQVESMGGIFHTGEAVLSLQPSGSSTLVHCEHYLFAASKVVLAIPKTALNKLIQMSPVLSKNQLFADAVNSVSNMELTKVGLYFHERWWHKETAPFPITNGPSFTDLPMGSVYCFSQYPANAGEDAVYNGPAALTIYTDFIRGNFWQEMQNIGPAYSSSIPQPVNTVAASANVVQEAMRQIKMVYGYSADDASIPMPLLSTFRVWGYEGFGYGYHQFKKNVADNVEFYSRICNPSANIYVCNEAWSPEQGWVEGSLLMSEFVLLHGFGIDTFTGANDKFFAKQTKKETLTSNPPV